MNDSKRAEAVSLDVLSVFDNALTIFWKWFWNGFAMHFGSVEKHCQHFKTQWKCSSTHFQCIGNPLQRKNASMLFSLSLLFPNRVTFVFSKGGHLWMTIYKLRIVQNTIQDAIRFVKSVGQNCFPAKTDIKNAFRIFPLPPGYFLERLPLLR